MERPFPPDRASREAALGETGRNVLVQAGAGTGKTTLIVERVVRLISCGIPLDRIAVVTFTEAAAAELRLLVRERLRVEKEAGDARFAKAASALSNAWISTIHGFASRVLREYFNLAGVDPSFEVTETHFTPVEADLEWNSFLLSADLPADVLELLRRTGTAVQKEVALAWEGMRWLDSVERVGSRGTVTTLMEGYLKEHAAAIESLLPECSDTSDLLFRRAVVMLDGLKTLKGQLPEPDGGLVSGLWSAIDIRGGSARNWADLDRARSVLARAREEFRRIAPVLGSGRLTELTWSFAGGFAQRLREKWDRDRSRLSFGDLLSFTRGAVERSDRLRTLLFERFDHVLIDEFQDTSMEQTRLFRTFLEREGKLPPGRLTVVADDKQSIYGWRSADIETYRDFRRRLEQGGALSVSITANFRSTSRIIRFVNVFGDALFSSRSPQEEPFSCEYSPIEPRPGAPEGVPVRILVLPEEGVGDTATLSGPAMSAAAQAGWFGDFVAGGLEAGGSPGDYALLYRAGTHVHRFVDALERRGIPYRVGSSRDFLRRQEIVDLREMVRCLLAPGDRLAWVHTLRSLFFGIDDRTVTAALDGGLGGYLDGGKGEGPEISSANSVLRRLRLAILTLPLADFLLELLLCTEMVQVICGCGHQVTRRLGNLQAVLEGALSGSITSPPELLRALDERLSPSRPEEPASVPPEGGAVTLTTVHRAKGLAWKHVVLSAMPVRSGGRPARVISYEHGMKAAFDLGVHSDDEGRIRLRSPFWPGISAMEKARDTAETRRLIYVAATRPRESLVILAERVESDSSGPAAVLWSSISRALEADPECCLVEQLPFAGEPPERGRAGAAEVRVGEGRQDSEPTIFRIAPEPEGLKSRGARIGDCVHAVMEKIHFRHPGRWFEEHREYLERLCGEDFEEVRELCMNFFTMELPFDPAGSEILGREYPCFRKGDDGLEMRYPDLLLRTPDGALTVVDYKTDRLNGEAGEITVGGYAETMGRYISDVSEAFAEEKTRGCLVFLRHRTFRDVGLSGTYPTG